MNALRNKVSLIGRLGAQPEVSKTDAGRMFARFQLATNEPYKNKSGEWVENTQWHNIAMWGKTAEFASQKLKKGQEVVVQGRLVHKRYEDKKGEPRYHTSVEVNEFLILTPKAADENK